MAAAVAVVDHCLCGNPLTLSGDEDEASIYCSTQCARQDALDSLSAKDPRHSSFIAPSLSSSTSFSSISSVPSLPPGIHDNEQDLDYEVDDVDVDDEEGLWEFVTPTPAPPTRPNRFLSHYQRVQARCIPQLPCFDEEANPDSAATDPVPTSPALPLFSSQMKRVPLRALDTSRDAEEHSERVGTESPHTVVGDDLFAVDRSRTPRSWIRDAAATPLPSSPADESSSNTSINSQFVSRLPIKRERLNRHSSVYDYGTVISRPPGLSLFSEALPDVSDNELSEHDVDELPSISTPKSPPGLENVQGPEVARSSSLETLSAQSIRGPTPPPKSPPTPPAKALVMQRSPSAPNPSSSYSESPFANAQLMPVPTLNNSQSVPALKRALTPIDTRVANSLTHASRRLNNVLEIERSSSCSPVESPNDETVEPIGPNAPSSQPSGSTSSLSPARQELPPHSAPASLSMSPSISVTTPPLLSVSTSSRRYLPSHTHLSPKLLLPISTSPSKASSPLPSSPPSSPRSPTFLTPQKAVQQVAGSPTNSTYFRPGALAPTPHKQRRFEATHATSLSMGLQASTSSSASTSSNSQQSYLASSSRALDFDLDTPPLSTASSATSSMISPISPMLNTSVPSPLSVVFPAAISAPSPLSASLPPSSKTPTSKSEKKRIFGFGLRFPGRNRTRSSGNARQESLPRLNTNVRVQASAVEENTESPTIRGLSFGDESDEEDMRDPFRYDSPLASRAASRRPSAPSSPVLSRAGSSSQLALRPMGSNVRPGLKRLPSMPDLPSRPSRVVRESATWLGGLTGMPVAEDADEEDEAEDESETDDRVWSVMQRLQRLKSAEILGTPVSQSFPLSV